jgi:small-conductance mechanosensitive channel
LRSYAVPVTAVVVVAAGWLAQAPLVAGLLVAGLVGLAISVGGRRPAT